MKDNLTKRIAPRALLGLLALGALLAVVGTATAAPSVNVSKTFGLEPGDWVLVQATGFAANGNISIAIDGVLAFSGKADNNGAVTQSVQVPYTAKAGYTKLTVTDNVNSVDASIQVKGSMESFVETMQSMTPLAKIVVSIFIICLPVLIGVGIWHWCKT
ncbi:MAG: hypothetical protein QOE90_3325 [Thermoplasmata archaeon]|jgi:hypothetical protein|nr:hypothetical protein [Thermoplasmata archaeon]